MNKKFIIPLVAVVCVIAVIVIAKSFFASDIVVKLITTALNNSEHIESWSSKTLTYDDNSNTLLVEELKIVGRDGISLDLGRLEAVGVNIAGKTVDSITASISATAFSNPFLANFFIL